VKDTFILYNDVRVRMRVRVTVRFRVRMRVRVRVSFRELSILYNSASNIAVARQAAVCFIN